MIRFMFGREMTVTLVAFIFFGFPLVAFIFFGFLQFSYFMFCRGGLEPPTFPSAGCVYQFRH